MSSNNVPSKKIPKILTPHAQVRVYVWKGKSFILYSNKPVSFHWLVMKLFNARVAYGSVKSGFGLNVAFTNM